MKGIACSRMYDVTPAVREHWHALLRIAAGRAGVVVECIDHAAPAPLEALWARDDLALAFMCGYPLATRYPEVRPLAAPLTALATDERPSYHSVWLVRAGSGFTTLAATFGHRIGWTVPASYSGFIGARHALLAYRRATRPRLYRESVGPLEHPRAALRALADKRIDVLALDAYWWWLLQRHDPAAAVGFRAVATTASAPMPPLVCSASLPEARATRLVIALSALREDPGARPHLHALGVHGFRAVTRDDYAPLARLDRIAQAADYPLPQ